MTIHDIADRNRTVDAQVRTTTSAAAADDHSQDHDYEHSFDWLEVARIVFVAVSAAAVWFQLWEPFQNVSVIGLAGLLVGGWPIFKEAF
jgi:Cd2+/Zn2+-exporting ATPase/Cu+-exporting ATPase